MIGTRLGPYEITAKLGEGGMGEVYRATDTKLHREVAIKVLPEAFTQDAERLQRFEREAQLLAQLHHPNIASIFGLEESGSTRALVMELVDGPTLADRLEQGSLSIEEGLSIARQIAEALEEAHEKGIVHRDLKPQNVKASIEGKVKVLDFGLAKAMDPVGAASGSASQLAASPTLTLGATVQGVILGTAAYMSPEQAAGGTADRRADVWSFGVVLFEMLAGRRLFEGETVSHVLAGVLKDEPDFSALPADTPPRIRRLLARCLRKKPRERLHSIADARIVIDEVLGGSDDAAETARSVEGAPGRGRTALPWGLAALFGVGLLLLGLFGGRSRPAAEPPRSVEISAPRGHFLSEEGGIAFAPDGSSVVFGAVEPVEGARLWLRRLDRFEAVPLRGTEDGRFPFWSPDSRSIGFFRTTDLTLCEYDLATESVRTLAKTGSLGRGGSWGSDGTILWVPSANSPILRLDLATGESEEVTVLDPGILDGSHRFPAWLPDGEHFLFTLWTNHLETAARLGGVHLASLEKGVLRRLAPDASQAVVAGDDRILVRRDGDLVALPFDPESLEVTGRSEVLAAGPLYSPSSGALGAGATPRGDLAFSLSAGESMGRLVWLDRDGLETPALGAERFGIQAIHLAPDGQRFAVQTNSAAGGNIWVGDGRRQVMSRLTPDASDSMFPVWSADGRKIAYMMEADGNQAIYLQEADGSRPAEVLLSDPERAYRAVSWTSDGRYLFLESGAKGEPFGSLWLYDFELREPREVLSGGSSVLQDAILSTDGRWLAYTSDESGNPEVFVRSFPALDRKWQVSQGGAHSPHWRDDGRELLYLSLADQAVQAVDVAPGPEAPEFGIPRTLFVPSSRLLGFAAAPDHSRFLAGVLPTDVRTEPIRLILNWRAGQSGERGR